MNQFPITITINWPDDPDELAAWARRLTKADAVVHIAGALFVVAALALPWPLHAWWPLVFLIPAGLMGGAQEGIEMLQDEIARRRYELDVLIRAVSGIGD